MATVARVMMCLAVCRLNVKIGDRGNAWYCQQFVDSKTAKLITTHNTLSVAFIVDALPSV